MTQAPARRFLDRTTPPHIVTLVLGAGLSAASMNIYLPSLPSMTEWFQTEYHLMQLSVSLYLGTVAVLQLFIGPLSDRFGRRPIMLGASAVFCLATLGTLYAPTIEIFLAFRVLQASVSCGIVLSRAIVRDMVPADKAASMIAYVTMGMALVPMLAPALGGFLDAYFGWQANFWFLFLAGLAVWVLLWADQGETAPRSGADFAATFRDAPELFLSRRFWGYCLATTFSSGAFFAYLGGAPFVGSVVFGLSPQVLGILFGAPAIGYLVGNGISGRFSVRFGINAMVLTGCVLVSIGMFIPLVLFYAGAGSVGVFFGFMTFVGLGNGLTIPNATAGMLSVRPKLAGTASGLGGAMMIGGGAALSSLSGHLLSAESGALPLIWMMWLSGIAGLASILYVLQRERALAQE